MLLGIRLHDTVKGDIDERLSYVKNQGFKCAHIALSKLYDDKKYYDNSALTPGYGMYLSKKFSKYDIDIAVLGCYLNLANPNPVKLEEIKQRYYANIRFASILNAGVVGTETGAVNEEYRYEPANKSKEALETFIRNLEPVVECAEHFNVTLAIEPVSKHIVCNAERAKYVLDSIKSHNLQIILDPVNLLSFDNYKQRNDVIKEAIALLGDNIQVVHIKDFLVKDDGELVSVAAGEGMMDYDDILSFIANEKPYIHVTLENTKPENAVKSKEFILNKFSQV